MGFFGTAVLIWAIGKFVKACGLEGYVQKLVQGIFSFLRHCLGWFSDLIRNGKINKNTHTPFMADGMKIPGMKDALKKAPTKNVGIFQGTYNEETDTVDHFEFIEADEVDQQTRDTLGNEPLVVLN